MISKIQSILLPLNLLLSIFSSVIAFAPVPTFKICHQICPRDIEFRGSSLGMFEDARVSNSGPAILTDGNGIEFSTGCTVMLTTEVKAFSIPKGAVGKFADDKSFIPIDWDMEGGIPRAEKCCVMPKGIRGAVRRVYTDEFDATHAIIVAFKKDNGFGGDYIPPSSFMMHFKTSEVEVITEDS